MNRISPKATRVLSLALLLGVFAGALSGCTEESRARMEAERAAEQAKIEAKQKNPEIRVIGIYDGCEVKYVDRYYASDSFYLARCGNTSTTTTKVRVGKVTQNRAAILQEIDELDKQREKLKAEAQSLEKREAALAKLTPDEQAALGIEVDKKKAAPPAGH
jgi:tRNA U55 pseudouridine synthase TruB